MICMFEGPLRNNTQEIFEPHFLKALTDKAIQANSESSLDMQPFIDVYGLEKVKEDYAEIADKMSSYLEHKLSPSSKMGFIFEAAFLQIGDKNGWFGPRSEIIRASKYDDIKNGVDMISTVERDDDSFHHMAIASDLTYSQQGSVEKFNRIVQNIRRGNLAQIRYFHSDLIGFTGQLSNIPRTVIGFDVNNLNLFLKQWVREPELAQLQYGLTALSQIREQSSAFYTMSAALHGKNSQTGNAYRRTVNTVDEILNQPLYKEIVAPSDQISTVISKLSERVREEYS